MRVQWVLLQWQLVLHTVAVGSMRLFKLSGCLHIMMGVSWPAALPFVSLPLIPPPTATTGGAAARREGWAAAAGRV